MKVAHIFVFATAFLADFSQSTRSLSRSHRKLVEPTKDDYLYRQEDGNITEDEFDNVYHTYYVMKRADCQEFIRRYPNDPIPKECTECRNDYIDDDWCEVWESGGACTANGSVAIQVCASACGSCQTIPGFPALTLGCRDHAETDIDCSNVANCKNAVNRMQCPGSCGLCKPDADGFSEFTNRPWLCSADVFFGQLSPEFQFALACGCWGFDINVYAVCCEEVQTKYQDLHYYDCSDLPPVHEKYHRRENLTWKRCCSDQDCDAGFGCAYGDFPGRNEWDIKYYSDDWVDPPCTGKCIKGLSIPRPWITTTTTPAPPVTSTTTRAPTTTTSYPAIFGELAKRKRCCMEAQCNWGDKCLCGEIAIGSNSKYFNCGDPYKCDGKCVTPEEFKRFRP